jgi:HK97 family phage major capsid protein
MKTHRNGMLLAVAASLAVAFVLALPADALAHPIGIIAAHAHEPGLLLAAAGVAAFAESGSLKALRDQRAAIVGDMRALLDKAEKEDRDLSDDEKTSFDGFKTKKEQLDARIERNEGVSEAEADLERTRPALARGQTIDPPRRHGEASTAFESLGQFMHAVRFNPNDQRLSNLYNPEAGANAVDLSAANDQRMDTGATGGFMIPPQFRADLFQSVKPADSLIRPRATVIPAGDPPDAPITFPALDQSGTTPGNSFGGFQFQWIAEGGLKPQGDVALNDITMEPHEAAGHVVVTDKLLRNWQSADAFLRRIMGQAKLAAEDYAFLRANGVGKPLGAINSGAVYKINRGTATTVKYPDIVNMEARLLMRGGAPIWSAAQSVLPQLRTLQDPLGNYIWKSIGTDDFNASDGISGFLNGYPLRWNNRQPGLGAYGDLILADWSYYLIKDGSGPFVAASEHVYFLNNKTVIKMFWNVDGAPWLQAPFAEENGYQVSPFVALDVPAG